MQPQRIDYGNHAEQFFHLHEPQTHENQVKEGKNPVLFLIHGGYWAQCYNLQNSLIDGLVGFFQSEGFWVCHFEYRRGNKQLDGGDGGWPETNEDVIRAMNRLEELSNEEAFQVILFLFFRSNYLFQSYLRIVLISIVLQF